MANSLPSFNILSFDFLPALRDRVQRLGCFTTDFSAILAEKGNVANVPLQTPTSASVWDPTNKYTVADETISTIDVTLGEPIYKEFYLSPLQTGTYTLDFLRPRIEAAAISVLDELEKQSYALLAVNQSTLNLAASSPGGKISGSAMNWFSLQSGSNALINSGSQGEISMLCPVPVYSIVQSDAKASGYGMWDTVSRGGDSFKYGDAIVRRAPKLNAQNVVYFTTPDAVALATRLPVPLAGYQRTLLVDDLTGMTIAVDFIEDTVGGIVRGRVHIIAGFKRARTVSVSSYSIA